MFELNKNVFQTGFLKAALCNKKHIYKICIYVFTFIANIVIAYNLFEFYIF